MGKFRIKIEELAKLHITKHLKSGNKANIKKLEKILEELSETHFEGTGMPEPLKHELTGFWSRKINQKDRLIYRVEIDIVAVFVIAAMGNYSDK
jgi:toxin YoeB